MAQDKLTRITHIERLPEELVERMRYWWVSKRRFRVLQQEFAAAGYTISATQARQWCEQLFPEVSARDSAFMGREAIADLWHKTLCMIRLVNEKNPMHVDLLTGLSKTVIQLVNADTTLAKHELDLEKWSQQRDKFARLARDILVKELKMLLTDEPELTARMQEIVDKAYRTVTTTKGLPTAELPPGNADAMN